MIKIAPGGVAARSGKLRIGDRLVKVNGHDMAGVTHREAVQRLLQPGPTLALTVRHDPLPQGFQVSILKNLHIPAKVHFIHLYTKIYYRKFKPILKLQVTSDFIIDYRFVNESWKLK